MKNLIKRFLKKINLFYPIWNFFNPKRKPTNSKDDNIYPSQVTLNIFSNDNELIGLNFHFNNPIEMFRIAQWGGEKEYVLNLIQSLKANDIFWDIGASVGLVSVLAAAKLNNGKVFSFEPDPENAMCLKKNLELNNITNTTIVETAVGDTKGTIELFSQGSNAFSPSLRSVNGIERTIKVPIDTLDSLLEQGKISAPTVIKIDIEGAEMMALKGMKSILSSKERPNKIFVEIHPLFLPEFNTSVHEIIKFMIGNGYIIDKVDGRDKQLLTEFSYPKLND